MDAIEQILNKIENGAVEEGLEQLKKLEKTADHQTKYAIAELYYELGHTENAKKIIDELLLFYPDEGGLYVFSSELLIDLGEEDEAIEQLSLISENDEAFLQAQLLLADLYQMQSLDEVAEQKLLLAEKIAPNEIIISYGLGLFYLERGDYLKSIPYLKKAVHSDEEIDDPRIELYLAEAFSASGQFEDAAKYYRLGLKKQLDLDALFGYAFTSYQLGDRVVAIEQLLKLKELDENYSSLYPLLSQAYEAEEKLEEAMEALNDGLAIDEFNEQLYILAGKLSFKRQNPDEGERYLREAIALNPANVEAAQTLLTYFKMYERDEDLLELISELRRYGEDDKLLTWYEGYALKEQDHYDEAFKRYKEVAEYFETDAAFLDEYGFFLLEYGLRDEAKNIFTKLFKMQPERFEIEQILEDLMLE